MAIVQALLAFLSRQTGKLLNMVFGWATTTLFGKVPQERQKWLSLLALTSVVWLIVVIGVVVPRVSVFLLSFVTLPSWINENVIRLVMLALALILPLLIGFISIQMLDVEDRPKGAANKAKAILRGYPSTLSISIALVMMLIFVPVMKIRTILKRWNSDHLPIMTEDENYLSVVSDLERALDQSGYEVTQSKASWMLRLPLKVMTTLSGSDSMNLIADHLTTLVSPSLELILHPSDLVINGKKQDVARVRAIVSEQLSFSKAYLTWTKEANEFEDRLGALWDAARAQPAGSVPPSLAQALKDIESDLRKSKLSYEEWEVLFREKLMVERGLLQVVAGLTSRPQEPAETNIKAMGAQQMVSAKLPHPLAPLIRAISMLAATAGALWVVERKLNKK